MRSHYPVFLFSVGATRCSIQYHTPPSFLFLYHHPSSLPRPITDARSSKRSAHRTMPSARASGLDIPSRTPRRRILIRVRQMNAVMLSLPPSIEFLLGQKVYTAFISAIIPLRYKCEFEVLYGQTMSYSTVYAITIFDARIDDCHGAQWQHNLVHAIGAINLARSRTSPSPSPSTSAPYPARTPSPRTASCIGTAHVGGHTPMPRDEGATRIRQQRANRVPPLPALHTVLFELVREHVLHKALTQHRRALGTG